MFEIADKGNVEYVGEGHISSKFAIDTYKETGGILDGDEQITSEDIRLMISYMPFQRNIQLNEAQKII